MKTARRHLYNSIQELNGMLSIIDDLATYSASYIDLEFINNLYTAYKLILTDYNTEWINLYSLNRDFKSRINLEDNLVIKDKLLHSTERTTAYLKRKRMSGKLFILAYIKKAIESNSFSTNTLQNLKSKINGTLNKDLKDWNYYYSNNKTKNCYELKNFLTCKLS